MAVEINANPWRLDLDWRWYEKALAFGCMMSINPDAHSTSELDLTHWGVEMARKGGVPAARVLNCLSLEDLLDRLTQTEETLSTGSMTIRRIAPARRRQKGKTPVYIRRGLPSCAQRREEWRDAISRTEQAR